MVSLAGAWGGTVIALQALTAREVDIVNGGPPIHISDVFARQMESVYWLMPEEDAFGDEIVATVNLTAKDGVSAVGLQTKFYFTPTDQ